MNRRMPHVNLFLLRKNAKKKLKLGEKNSEKKEETELK